MYMYVCQPRVARPGLLPSFYVVASRRSTPRCVHGLSYRLVSSSPRTYSTRVDATAIHNVFRHVHMNIYMFIVYTRFPSEVNIMESKIPPQLQYSATNHGARMCIESARTQGGDA